LIGQLALHLYCMEYVTQLGIKFSSPNDLKITHDEEFIPTFLNTVLFLYSLLSQTCIFLFNHGGLPHMESLSSNRRYVKLLVAPILLCFFLALNINSDLNYTFELNFKDVDPDTNT